MLSILPIPESLFIDNPNKRRSLLGRKLVDIEKLILL
jgi:hypothetical protein